MAKAGKRSNDEADYGSKRSKKSKSSKSNGQPSQMGDVPDSEEDLGHSSSVKFLTAAKEPANSSHAVVSELRNTVEEGKQKLADLLEAKVLGLMKREYELKETLINVFLYTQREQTELEEKEVKQFSILKPTASAIYCRAKSDIASSRALLGHYERAYQQVALSKRVPTMESGWQKNSQTLQRIIDNQREKTTLQTHQLLNKDPKPSEEQVEEDVSTLDTDLWDQFAVGEARKEPDKMLNRRERETWAVIARNAQRGVRRALKDLPEYDE